MHLTSDSGKRSERMNSFHRVAPLPSTSRSDPRMGMPFTHTVALQIIPRPQRMTCSAVNGSQRRSLIWPCICNRTADASLVPGAMAYSK
jgi:hypothetical protein